MRNRSCKIRNRAAILLAVLVISACSQMNPAAQVPTPLPSVPYLDIFPVYPGTSWAYERVDYERYPDPNQTLTVTYQITETVSNAQVKGTAYIAHITGSKKLLAKDAGWVEPDDSKSYEFWYVLQDGAVYKTQQVPDPAALHNSGLELQYQLPLSVGETWCPLAAAAYPGGSCQFSGQYSVLGMQPVQTKSAIIDGCYQIRQFFNDGSFFSLFCMMVGPAGAKYDHNGTPFGYNQTLTSFIKGPPPSGLIIPVPTPFASDQTARVVKTCTLKGCMQTIVIRLTGTIPPDFTLSAAEPEGKTAKAHCINGQNSDPSDFTTLLFQPVCSPDQVSFTGFAPVKVTLQVTWASQSISLEAVPAYETLHPNGPQCDPSCRVGTISLDFK